MHKNKLERKVFKSIADKFIGKKQISENKEEIHPDIIKSAHPETPKEELERIYEPLHKEHVVNDFDDVADYNAIFHMPVEHKQILQNLVGNPNTPLHIRKSILNNFGHAPEIHDRYLDNPVNPLDNLENPLSTIKDVTGGLTRTKFPFDPRITDVEREMIALNPTNFGDLENSYHMTPEFARYHYFNTLNSGQNVRANPDPSYDYDPETSYSMLLQNPKTPDDIIKHSVDTFVHGDETVRNKLMSNGFGHNFFNNPRAMSHIVNHLNNGTIDLDDMSSHYLTPILKHPDVSKEGLKTIYNTLKSRQHMSQDEVRAIVKHPAISNEILNDMDDEGIKYPISVTKEPRKFYGNTANKFNKYNEEDRVYINDEVISEGIADKFIAKFRKQPATTPVSTEPQVSTPVPAPVQPVKMKGVVKSLPTQSSLNRYEPKTRDLVKQLQNITGNKDQKAFYKKPSDALKAGRDNPANAPIRTAETMLSKNFYKSEDKSIATLKKLLEDVVDGFDMSKTSADLFTDFNQGLMGDKELLHKSLGHPNADLKTRTQMLSNASILGDPSDLHDLINIHVNHPSLPLEMLENPNAMPESLAGNPELVDHLARHPGVPELLKHQIIDHPATNKIPDIGSLIFTSDNATPALKEKIIRAYDAGNSVLGDPRLFYHSPHVPEDIVNKHLDIINKKLNTTEYVHPYLSNEEQGILTHSKASDFINNSITKNLHKGFPAGYDSYSDRDPKRQLAARFVAHALKNKDIDETALTDVFNKIKDSSYAEKTDALQSIIGHPNVHSDHLLGLLDSQLKSDTYNNQVDNQDIYTNAVNDDHTSLHSNINPEHFLKYMDHLGSSNHSFGPKIRQFIYNLRNNGHYGEQALQRLAKGSNSYIADLAKTGLRETRLKQTT